MAQYTELHLRCGAVCLHWGLIPLGVYMIFMSILHKFNNPSHFVINKNSDVLLVRQIAGVDNRVIKRVCRVEANLHYRYSGGEEGWEAG